jgi:ectoine hydroxylase-related dioxygenase (phytanoyl-CoA dioxygenase family)
MFDRRYLDVLDVLFQCRAWPCQSLAYLYGSQQDAHQDTIHLTAFPAGYMCGIWIALEDVRADSGELAIYPGSHRFPRRYMHQAGCAKVRDDWTEFGNTVVRQWQEDVADSGIEQLPYRPRKGTVLIWHENLMHLGTVRRNLDLTRRSIVFHCFAEGAVVFYDSTGEVGFLEPA